MSYRTEWDSVPDARDDVAGLEVDPHWLDLQQRTALPTAYMPTSVGGPQAPWRRMIALVVLVMLLAATASGICLTYGPHELFDLIKT